MSYWYQLARSTTWKYKDYWTSTLFFGLTCVLFQFVLVPILSYIDQFRSRISCLLSVAYSWYQVKSIPTGWLEPTPDLDWGTIEDTGGTTTNRRTEEVLLITWTLANNTVQYYALRDRISTQQQCNVTSLSLTTIILELISGSFDTCSNFKDTTCSLIDYSLVFAINGSNPHSCGWGIEVHISKDLRLTTSFPRNIARYRYRYNLFCK